MSNLQPNCCLEFDFRKVDQHAGGKWLIHDTKRRKENQLQSLKPMINFRLSSVCHTSKQRDHTQEQHLVDASLSCFMINCYLA